MSAINKLANYIETYLLCQPCEGTSDIQTSGNPRIIRSDKLRVIRDDNPRVICSGSNRPPWPDFLSAVTL